jgi:hypothetical protein
LAIKKNTKLYLYEKTSGLEAIFPFSQDRKGSTLENYLIRPIEKERKKDRICLTNTTDMAGSCIARGSLGFFKATLVVVPKKIISVTVVYDIPR